MTELTTMATVSLDYPIKALINTNQHLHRHVQAVKRRDLRSDIGLVARNLKPVPTPARVTVEFGWPDRIRRDADNYEIKGAIDALVDVGVLPDDNGTHIPETMRRDLGKTHDRRGWVQIRVIVESLGGAA